LHSQIYGKIVKRINQKLFAALFDEKFQLQFKCFYSFFHNESLKISESFLREFFKTILTKTMLSIESL
jgi:hypothetical protein